MSKLRLSVSLNTLRSRDSGKGRLPPPTITGKTIRRSSSTRSRSSSECTRVALPATRIGPSWRCFSSSTAGASSPRSRLEFSHSSGSERVEETTYFGIELTFSANSPWRSGQAPAKDS